MEKGQVMIFETNYSKETFELGKQLGKKAKKGQIYCLNGSLGVGKTVFTQGFAAGLEIKEAINSPTFISKPAANPCVITEFHTPKEPFKQ